MFCPDYLERVKQNLSSMQGGKVTSLSEYLIQKCSKKVKCLVTCHYTDCKLQWFITQKHSARLSCCYFKLPLRTYQIRVAEFVQIERGTRFQYVMFNDNSVALTYEVFISLMSRSLNHHHLIWSSRDSQYEGYSLLGCEHNMCHIRRNSDCKISRCSNIRSYNDQIQNRSANICKSDISNANWKRTAVQIDTINGKRNCVVQKYARIIEEHLSTYFLFNFLIWQFTNVLSMEIIQRMSILTEHNSWKQTRKFSRQSYFLKHKRSYCKRKWNSLSCLHS
jgi:hypothetical protein